MVTYLSVVAPVHNESESIKNFVFEVQKILEKIGFGYEIILVDDGSTDDSWEQLKSLSSFMPQIRAVKLSKNFGKDGAIFAGLSVASGEVTVVLDSDLQHPPSLIPEMLEIHNSGIDIVIATKNSRPDQSLLVKAGASIWSTVFQFLSGYNVRNTTDFRLIGKRQRELLLQTVNSRSFFRFRSGSEGFSQQRIYFDPDPRESGTTTFNFWKLSTLAVRSITSSSTRPLHFVTIAAVLAIFSGFVLSTHTFIMWLLGESTSGFTTVILLILFIGGLQLLSLGIIGEYMSNLTEISQKKPAFVIEEIFE